MAKTTGSRLQGSDGKLVQVTLGTELVGDGTSDLDTLGAPAGTTKYEITAIATSGSAFASSYETGYIFWDDGSTLVLASGDKVKPLVETDLCDVQSWGLEFNKDEIEATTLCDTTKKYLAGKTDVTGSLNGVYTIGTTDKTDGFLNQFVEIVSASIGSSVSIDAVNTDNIYIELIKQKSETSGDIFEMYYGQVVITSFSDGVENGSAQAFSSSFRVAADDQELRLYQRTIA